MSAKKSGQKSLPGQLLDKISKVSGDFWKRVDIFRSSLDQNSPEWDPRVFIPYNSWFDFVKQEYPHVKDITAIASFVRNLAAVGAWRPTQDIVRFDPDLYESLSKTELTGNLPAEILQRLPAWGIYVEAPGLEYDGNRYEGFFAGLDVCNEPGLVLMAINLLDANLRSLRIVLPLGEWDLATAVEKTNDDFKRGMERLNRPFDEDSLLKLESGLVQILNLLIYVCSYGLVEHGSWADSGGSGGYTPKKVRGIWRFFPPDRPKIRLMGEEFGDQLRKYAKTVETGASHQHSRPRPHLRRAHWHGYWKGSMKKDAEKPRQFSVRWLPPIQVGWLEEETEEEGLKDREPPKGI